MVKESHIHRAGKLHKNEEKFLKKLAQILKPDWHIFCGMKFSHDLLAPNGEIDFILWHPRKGIAIFELKNDSRIQIFSRGNGEISVARPGKNADKNLLDQVRHEAAELQQFFTRGNAPFPMVACLVLEETARPKAFAGTDFLSAGTEIPIFFAGEIDENLNTILSKMLQKWRSRNQTAIDDFSMKFVANALGAFFDRAILLNDTAEDEKLHYANFTRDQNAAMQVLAAKSAASFCVSGGAGTGKTLVAQHLFRVETFKNRRRVLMLGWNKIHHWMQNYFIAKNGVPEHESRILTAEMIARELLAGTAFAGTQNFDELWGNAAKIARERPEMLDEFDVVIVDEGQLLNEKIWEIVEVFHTKGARLIVFFDKNQRVIGGTRMPEWLGNLPQLTLTTSCRCTPKIFKFIRQNILDDGCDLMPELDEKWCKDVLVFDCGDDGEFRADAMARIGEIVRKNGLDAVQTIILGRRSKPDFDGEFAGRKIVFPQDKMIRVNKKNDFVQYFSIAKFTGCEADYVVVYLPTNEDWRVANYSNRSTIYEACTRARSRLILALPSKAVDDLRERCDELTFFTIDYRKNPRERIRRIPEDLELPPAIAMLEGFGAEWEDWEEDGGSLGDEPLDGNEPPFPPPMNTDDGLPF